MRWTSMKLASRVARLGDLDDEAKTRLHRVFRNMVAKGVAEVVLDEDDGRGTLRFDDDNAAVLLLLVYPASAFATEVRFLREAAAAMRTRIFAGDIQPNEVHEGETKISAALEAVRLNKKVTLVVTIIRDAQRNGVRTNTFFEIEGENTTSEVAELLKSSREIRGELITLTIPANDLLKPLFADLD